MNYSRGYAHFYKLNLFCCHSNYVKNTTNNCYRDFYNFETSTAKFSTYFHNTRISKRNSIKYFSVMSSEQTNVKALFTQSKEDLNGPLLRHLFEESAALDVYDKSTINLAAGCPGPDLLSKLPNIMRKATEHRMKEEEGDNYYLFQYGPTAGLWGLREALSHFLTRNYKSEVSRGDLIMTCGATHGLHLTVSVLLSDDAVIFVEEFTYMIALSLFKEFPGHKIVKVPMSKNGVDVKKLEEIVKSVKQEKQTWNTSEDKPFWAMFYTIPTFHNPTSRLLPPESCRELAKVAEDLGMLVICDDVYNLLHFTPEPPARLYSFENKKSNGHVISNGSFSKILAPGIRVGWMEMSPVLVQRFRRSGILQSGGSVNNVMYGIMQSILELGLGDEHLQFYKEIYEKRMTALCDSLKENLPDGCSFQVPLGGYFLWLELPFDGVEFLAWCKQNGNIGAVPALRFMPSVDKINEENLNAIRLSIGFHNEDTLKSAGEILGQKLQIYINNKQTKK